LARRSEFSRRDIWPAQHGRACNSSSRALLEDEDEEEEELDDELSPQLTFNEPEKQRSHQTASVEGMKNVNYNQEDLY
jgi:hypothetical protein